MQSPPRYRSDVEGLRAVAVVAVILGHAREDWLPGGYLGVDVFFVISGFVITRSLIDQDREPFGRFLAGFFLRRAKRILPALLFCLLVTGVMLILLDPSPRQSLQTGAAALFGLANVSIYLQELDYFAATIRYNAFTHTWSLGVEEQFYLVFPFLVYLTLMSGRRRNLGEMLALVAGLSLLSWLAFVLVHEAHPMVAYYLTPFRFWQIGMGAVVAIYLAKTEQRPFRFDVPRGQLLLISGLILMFALPVAAPVLRHSLVALLTAGLILLGRSKARQSKLLTLSSVRYAGRISYSLYLWHWPALTFGLLAPFGLWANQLVMAGLLLAMAALSYHLIEQPVRQRATPVPGKWHAAASLGGIMAVIAVVTGVKEVHDLRGPAPFETALRPTTLPLPEYGRPHDPTCVIDRQNRPLRDETFVECTFAPKSPQTRTLWAMGDSHAGHLQALLIHLHQEDGLGFHLVESVGATYPVSQAEPFPPREQLFQTIRAHWKPGDVVVLSRLYLYREAPFRALPDLPLWLGLVDALTAELAAEGINIALVGPPPLFQFEDIRACDPVDVESCSVPKDDLEPVIEEVTAGLQSIADKHPNALVLKVFDHFCPPHAPLCSPARNGVFQFRDRDHVNVAGAAGIAPRFRALLDEFD